MQDTTLLVIDMQKAYFNNDALAERKDELVNNTNVLITQFQQANRPVILIRTEHERDASTWTLNMLDDGSGYLFKDDTDADYVDGLSTSNTTELIKTRDSAFRDTDLADRLRMLGVQRLVLAGVSTHSCVLYTAADAYADNFRVILAVDAIASHDPKYHDRTLRMLEQEYRQRPMTNAAIIAELSN